MVELSLRYNLYNGGSDLATIRRFDELLKQAEATLDKTSRELAQAVRISYNDINSSQRQLPQLDQHRRSARIMEAAYRQQFEVGRRSLLDLLDAQNEAFQAERAYVNALFDLENAKASHLAESGEILRFFNVMREDVPAPEKLGIRPSAETQKRAQ